MHSINEVQAVPDTGLEGAHFKKFSTQQCLQGIRWNNTLGRQCCKVLEAGLEIHARDHGLPSLLEHIEIT